MTVKVLELELTEAMKPIPVLPGYDSYYILVRFNMRPIGWIWAHKTNEAYITIEQLQEALNKHLAWQVTREALRLNLGMDKKNIITTEAISIVVCTRNRTQQLAGCLQSLLASEYPAFEIIIIDNAPSNNDTRYLVETMPVRYILEERPGLDWARNRGIEEARYDIVAFTDDDASVDRFWLKAINKAFVNRDVMAVTGYVAPAKLETPAQFSFEFGYGGMGHGFNRRIIRSENLTQRQLLWASSFGVGANMAFRRDVFSRIGKFHVALDVGTPSLGGGDIEMFNRLVMRGNVLVYEPAMLVWHNHRQYTSSLRKQIYANGRGFGCYLITCLLDRRAKPFSILKFFFIDWFLKWNFKNFIKPPKMLGRYLSILELAGMLSSPFAYKATTIHAKKNEAQFRKASTL